MAARVENHVPRQLSNLAGAQTSLCRQQYDDLVADRVTSTIDEEQEVVYVARGKDLGLFTEHVAQSTSKKLYRSHIEFEATLNNKNQCHFRTDKEMYDF